MTHKSMSFNHSAVVTIRKNDYGINFWFMAKGKAGERMKNAVLSEKN